MAGLLIYYFAFNILPLASYPRKCRDWMLVKIFYNISKIEVPWKLYLNCTQILDSIMLFSHVWKIYFPIFIRNVGFFFFPHSFSKRLMADHLTFSNTVIQLLFQTIPLFIDWLKLIFLFTFWPCGILVPQPEMEPVPPALETQSLNHWVAREVPPSFLFWICPEPEKNWVSHSCAYRPFSYLLKQRKCRRNNYLVNPINAHCW